MIKALVKKDMAKESIGAEKNLNALSPNCPEMKIIFNTYILEKLYLKMNIFRRMKWKKTRQIKINQC